MFGPPIIMNNCPRTYNIVVAPCYAERRIVYIESKVILDRKKSQSFLIHYVNDHVIFFSPNEMITYNFYKNKFFLKDPLFYGFFFWLKGCLEFFKSPTIRLSVHSSPCHIHYLIIERSIFGDNPKSMTRSFEPREYHRSH